MSFIYYQFLILFLPAVFVLFYFWITQIEPQYRDIKPSTLEKIRFNRSGIGLKGANVIFLFAAIFIVLAISEPVIYKDDKKSKDLAVAIFLDLENFDKNLAKRVVHMSSEAEIFAISQQIYRVAPRSSKKSILSYQIEHLEAASSSDVSKIFHSSDITVYVGHKNVDKEFISISNIDDLKMLKTALDKLSQRQKNHNYIPLFYYPLAIAMVLILIGLYSMSSRESVSVAGIFIALMLSNQEADAFDFLDLSKASSAYESGDYAVSAKIYRDYAQKYNSSEARYNYANSLYQLGEHHRACIIYRNIKSDNRKLNSYINHNLKLCNEPEKKEEAQKIAVPKKATKKANSSSDYKTKMFKLDL